MKTSRRNFITKSALAAAGFSAGLTSMAKANNITDSFEGSAKINAAKKTDAFRICIFSKHLQWLDWSEMAMVSAEMGFDGVDLTVRPQGHVLPERVVDDLPKAMEAVKKAGSNIFMITTAINDADDPLSEKILKTAASLGIRHYRMGYFYYEDDKTIDENLNTIQLKLTRLAKLNEKYSISGEYQNHSGISGTGIYFGSPIWDLGKVLKDINSHYLGSQYDICHATVEGFDTWPVGLKLLSRYIGTIDIKDYQWLKKNGRWTSEAVPLGEGMVDYKKYTALLKQFNISGPISIHYEYPLGGAEHGAKRLTMKRDEVVTVMKKDLETYKSYLQQNGLI
ncbi:MAG: TIM barrel protein [Bacteroidales bacterium]|nr:TIM barrel protein [Bacteroidales bacterium]